MMQRNEYVLKNMFGSFFLASVMSSLMAQLGSITDSIILSHLVSPDALSVFRVWLPVESIVFLVIGLMSAGASFLSTRGIGAQNYDKVKPFVKACELDCGIAARVAIEELVHEIMETNAGRKPEETFDVRIIDKETVFTAVLKSKGPLRNPIYKYTDDEIMDLDRRDMRRAVMTRMCNDINHKYMNGINCIYLNYTRNKELA